MRLPSRPARRPVAPAPLGVLGVLVVSVAAGLAACGDADDTAATVPAVSLGPLPGGTATDGSSTTAGQGAPPSEAAAATTAPGGGVASASTTGAPTSAPATSPPTTAAPTTSTTVARTTTTAARPPCDISRIVADTGTQYAGITPSDLRCAGTWASWVGRPDDPMGDGFFAVAEWTGSGWELANLGTAEICGDGGVPAELWEALACLE